MDFDEKVKAAVSIIDEQAESLKEIIEQAIKDLDLNIARERKNRWKERTALLIEQKIHPNEAEKLRNKRKGSFIGGDPLRNLADEGDMYLGFLQSVLTIFFQVAFISWSFIDSCPLTIIV